MKFIKKYLKLFICIAAIILTIIVFFLSQRGSSLESGVLKKWLAASDGARAAAVRVLTASDLNTDMIVACVTKMAQLPESAEFAVSDAVRLCNMGIQLKENN